MPNITDYFSRKANLFLQSDGACRDNLQSSTGWKLKAVSPTLKKAVTLATGGKLIDKGLPSLVIELIALDDATEQLHEWITTSNTHHTHIDRTSHKRPHDNSHTLNHPHTSKTSKQQHDRTPPTPTTAPTDQPTTWHHTPHTHTPPHPAA